MLWAQCVPSVLDGKEYTMKTITITIKYVYGNAVVYPHCDDSRVFAQIAGTKTLTPDTIRLIRLLGYEVKQNFVFPAIPA